MNRILIVDDKEMMRDSVAATLARKDYAVTAASGGRAALEKMDKRPPDVVITDLQMPEMSGLDLLAEVRKIDEQIPVVFMTAYGTVETAVEAMKQGAFDYITKPFSGDELVLAVERAMRHATLLRENQILKAAATPSGARSAASRHQMIGNSMVMQHLRRRLGRIADSHGTVLVTGESGTGKEVAARWVHEHSPRKGQPFLALNCAALSTNLLESELFGHEKGAFTGADKTRKGRFELADGGTLLLDEISEIAPEIQAKLLRVLQEKSFERVGSGTAREVDVRVIATTNRDLPREVAAGTFRQDLYYRLNVLPLAMPPLRQRREDVGELVDHFLHQVSQREGKGIKTVEEAALHLLRGYHWPGNVRELQNICERAAVLTEDTTIAGDLVEPWLMTPMGGVSRRNTLVESKDTPPTTVTVTTMPGLAAEITAPPTAELSEEMAARLLPEIICDGSEVTLEEVERDTIVATLHHFNGHRQKSARALGIGVRTLGLKLKKWKELRLVDADL